MIERCIDPSHDASAQRASLICAVAGVGAAARGGAVVARAQATARRGGSGSADQTRGDRVLGATPNGAGRPRRARWRSRSRRAPRSRSSARPWTRRRRAHLPGPVRERGLVGAVPPRVRAVGAGRRATQAGRGGIGQAATIGAVARSWRRWRAQRRRRVGRRWRRRARVRGGGGARAARRATLEPVRDARRRRSTRGAADVADRAATAVALSDGQRLVASAGPRRADARCGAGRHARRQGAAARWTRSGLARARSRGAWPEAVAAGACAAAGGARASSDRWSAAAWRRAAGRGGADRPAPAGGAARRSTTGYRRWVHQRSRWRRRPARRTAPGERSRTTRTRRSAAARAMPGAAAARSLARRPTRIAGARRGSGGWPRAPPADAAPSTLRPLPAARRWAKAAWPRSTPRSRSAPRASGARFVVKRLRAELAREPAVVAQFIDEAKLGSTLVHSNIVPVFDFGKVGDEYFLAQEYILGPRPRAAGRAARSRCSSAAAAERAGRCYVAHETLRGAGVRAHQARRRRPAAWASSTATSRPATSWCRRAAR